jgi:transposase
VRKSLEILRNLVTENKFRPTTVKKEAAACLTGIPRIGVRCTTRPIIAPGPYFIVRSGKMKEQRKEGTRYVGIDLGKRTYTAAIVGKGGKVEKSNGKTYVEGRRSLYKKLQAGDRVAIEAGNMAFLMAKEIEAAVGCRVYVLNPSQLALIYGSMKKTDKEDSLKLARIIEDIPEERLPAVPVPSEKEMKRRKLLSIYQQTQGERNSAICRLHGLFLEQGITTVVRADLATAGQREEATKQLSGLQLKRAKYHLKCLELYEAELKETEQEMEAEAAGDEEIERLQSVPGVGPKVAFAFVAHVAAERFEDAGQVSNYLGLVPRVYISGDTVRYGRITKRGNGYVRALLVQAAWALIRAKKGGKLKERYEYMTIEKSISKKKAIVAIARRIGELLYTMMRDKSWYATRPFIRDKKAIEEMVQEAASA